MKPITEDVTDSGIYALLALRNSVDAVSGHRQRRFSKVEKLFLIEMHVNGTYRCSRTMFGVVPHNLIGVNRSRSRNTTGFPFTGKCAFSFDAE